VKIFDVVRPRLNLSQLPGRIDRCVVQQPLALRVGEPGQLLQLVPVLVQVLLDQCELEFGFVIVNRRNLRNISHGKPLSRSLTA